MKGGTAWPAACISVGAMVVAVHVMGRRDSDPVSIEARDGVQIGLCP